MKRDTPSNAITEKVSLVHGGSDFFDRLEALIADARSEIHLQTYILEEDATGTKISNALKKAVSRNVTVYLLLDGLGSRALSDKFVDDIKSSGIQFRFFSPLLSSNSFYFGRRLHHKIVVIDTQTVLIGGINIAKKYEGTPSEAPWLDYAVLIHDETTARHAKSICHYYFFKKRKRFFEKTVSDEPNNPTTTTLLQNDWLRRKSEIQKTYIKSIYTAQNEIIIVCGYFLPGKKLTKALEKAAQKKVRIRLILSGVSDVPLVKEAINYYYAFLLRNNIELYEWNQSILHGKTAVVDQKWTTIGSFNLNHLSSYASIEMNAGIDSKPFAENYQKHLETIISQCTPITSESFRTQNNVLTRFKQWVSYYIVRFFEILLTYLPYNRFLKSILK
ncbi:phospholipase D/Transphosphatidylase [Flavobacterium saliperosum S13]|uniref:Phospholipase D/Transphosphatidylase n=2 Tax=Flavobacterium saliperosum TaxID=329186 RepID=A0ABP2ZZH9_9FLAO|nr:phospholipase D-like domain-containing protein [Flavobacterium saliperosum]ESU27985.1 phospholipase D/Transphosphatidylase [Flavobacterium saliperosum S13]SCX02374.1 putative cardiolipin synthase [Flavobacterium saliperosum]